VANAQVDDNLTTARTIARILKVNHAGEHGAIREGGRVQVTRLLSNHTSR
jgi:hypothetical protein